MNWRMAKHRAWRLPVIWDSGDDEPEKLEERLVNWRMAKHRAWRLPVIWDSGDDEPEKLTATAETVQPVTVLHLHVVRHLHLTSGGDAAGLGQLPHGSAAIE